MGPISSTNSDVAPPDTLSQDQNSSSVSKEVDELAAYSLPRRRLKHGMGDPSKDPLILVACGKRFTHDNQGYD